MDEEEFGRVHNHREIAIRETNGKNTKYSSRIILDEYFLYIVKY